jgi:exonuclease-1
MGIGGLLMNTKSIGRRKNISEYRNQRAGIDGYSWLHKALHHCAVEVAIHKNLYKIVRYFEKILKCLLSLNMKVVIVFDGDKLPLKGDTESSRHENRQKNFDIAMHSYHSGRHEEANRLFGQAIDITPAMAYFVKTKLEEIFPSKLEFLVAPYEADSQLAYLSKMDLIDLVITEDSDLLVFGAKKMFYKMDKDFWGVEVELCRLSECGDYSFKDWSHDKFIQFCIIAGCDYLPSPRGIAFKKAYACIAKYGSIEKVLNVLSDKLEKDYFDRFLCAYLAFKFQRVFCPIKKQIVSLNPFKLDELGMSNSFDFFAAKRCLLFFGSLDFLGKDMDDKTACNLANCKIDPITKTNFVQIVDFGFRSDKKSRESLKSIKKRLEHKTSLFMNSKKIEEAKESNFKSSEFFNILGLTKEEELKFFSAENVIQSDNSHIGSKNSIDRKAIKLEQMNSRSMLKGILQKATSVSQSTSESANDGVSRLMDRFRIENQKRKPELKSVLEVFRSKLLTDLK